MAQTGTNRTRADRDEPDVGQGDGEREPGQAQEMLEQGLLGDNKYKALVARILLHPHRLDVRLNNS